MKRFFCFISLATALALASIAPAATSVQALVPGDNMLIGGPGKVLQIEALAESATGTVTVQRVLDQWTYTNSIVSVTNSWTNSVAWTNETVTNSVVVSVDDYSIVTNSIYTNIVWATTNSIVTNVVGGVTNSVITNIAFAVTNYLPLTNRVRTGGHLETNEVVTMRPVWTQTLLPFKTSTVTNDVVTHTITTNTVGTIALDAHTGTLVPTNLYFTGGDVYIIDMGAVTGSAVFRLYSEEE